MAGKSITQMSHLSLAVFRARQKLTTKKKKRTKKFGLKKEEKRTTKFGLKSESTNDASGGYQ